MKEIERLDIDTDKLNVEIENEKVSVSVKEKENNTLADLNQKLINELFHKPVYMYELKDVEILKILFR